MSRNYAINRYAEEASVVVAWPLLSHSGNIDLQQGAAPLSQS